MPLVRPLRRHCAVHIDASGSSITTSLCSAHRCLWFVRYDVIVQCTWMPLVRPLRRHLVTENLNPLQLHGTIRGPLQEQVRLKCGKFATFKIKLFYYLFPALPQALLSVTMCKVGRGHSERNRWRKLSSIGKLSSPEKTATLKISEQCCQAVIATIFSNKKNCENALCSKRNWTCDVLGATLKFY